MIPVCWGTRFGATAVALGVLAGLGAMGCGASSDTTGSLAITVQVSGQGLASVNYNIGGNGIVKTGNIELGAGTPAVTTVDGIPGGKQYVIEIRAANPNLGCYGSSLFDMTAGATVSTQVMVWCPVP